MRGLSARQDLSLVLDKTCERCNFYKDEVFSAPRTWDERNGSGSLKPRL